MSYNSRFDWSGFFVHFVFGAVVGAALGFGLSQSIRLPNPLMLGVVHGKEFAAS